MARFVDKREYVYMYMCAIIIIFVAVITTFRHVKFLSVHKFDGEAKMQRQSKIDHWRL